MSAPTRRHILAAAAAAPLAAAASGPRKMTIQLSCGSIGVKANQRQALAYAAQFGFESIDAYGGELAAMPQAEVDSIRAEMKQKNIVWGTAGLPVEFRRDEDTFKTGITTLRKQAPVLQAAGVERVSTWIMPGHESLTYLENFRQHARRLREAALILRDHNLRFGLEYVGPRTIRATRRYPFVYCMKEMRELIAEINVPNMGMVMDSWHWYTAGETVAELKTLSNKEVVSIDLNDAPTGRSLDEQKDSEREIPCATGVIDMAAFVNELHAIGCDAPARCEPFNAALRALPPEQALQKTIDAMKKAFSLIRS